MKQEIIESRKKAIQEDLKRVAALNNNKISFSFYKQHGEHSVPKVIAYFKGFKNACETLNIEFERKFKEPDTKLQNKYEEMAKLLSEGKTLQEIGVKFGISRERVRQVTTKLGIKSKRKEVAALKHRELTQEELNQIKDLHLNGHKSKSIALKLNLYPVYVKSLIKKHGFKFGSHCVVCGTATTKVDYIFHCWKYCDKCALARHNKRHADYFRKKFHENPEFKKRVYKANKLWRESEKGRKWLKDYQGKRATLAKEQVANNA